MLYYIDLCRVQASFDMVMAFLRESIDSYEGVYEKIDQLRSLVSLDQDQPVNSSTQQQDFFRTRSKYVSEIVIKTCPTGQCEVLGKSTSLLGFQPPTPVNPLQDS